MSRITTRNENKVVTSSIVNIETKYEASIDNKKFYPVILKEQRSYNSKGALSEERLISFDISKVNDKKLYDKLVNEVKNKYTNPWIYGRSW